MEIPKVAADSGADLAMVDTAVKDGKTLFDFMKTENVNRTVNIT
jgi:uncharacterized protein (UPF0264 family)